MRADPRGREIVMEVMLAFVLIVLVLVGALSLGIGAILLVAPLYPTSAGGLQRALAEASPCAWPA